MPEEDSMKTRIYAGIAVMCLFLCATVRAQQIAPPILKEPFGRPKYLTIIQTNNASTLLKTISEMVKKEGFKIDQLDIKEQQLEATRQDSAPAKNYDKVILWLEKDFQDPDKFVKVYFLYGRFMEILAEEKGVYRVKLTDSAEESRIGKLKQSIIALSTS
jgi:hypothetical protein